MVGLVEDGDRDVVEADVALAEVVLEATGAGDDDVDALAEGGDLRAGRDTTEHRDGAEAERLRHRHDGFVDLGDEFTGRRQDEGTRLAAGLAVGGAHTVGGEAGDEGKGERERLARAGAPPAEHVATGEGVGQRGGLDGERVVDAGIGEHLGEGGGHAELFEGGPVVERGVVGPVVEIGRVG